MARLPAGVDEQGGETVDGRPVQTSYTATCPDCGVGLGAYFDPKVAGQVVKTHRAELAKDEAHKAATRAARAAKRSAATP